MEWRIVRSNASICKESYYKQSYQTRLIIDNVIITQQFFVLLITHPIILVSDFLDIYFAMLDIGDLTITLCCADYMLTTSLTYYPVYN